MSKKLWDDPEYYEKRARDERIFAEQERRRRSGTVESMRIHLENAERYEALAAKLRAKG